MIMLQSLQIHKFLHSHMQFHMKKGEEEKENEQLCLSATGDEAKPPLLL